MMAKLNILFLDLDGVLVRKESYFSDRFSRDFGVPKDKVMKFFRSEMVACARGQADLKVELAKYLSDWGWQGSVDELLEYWFSAERTLEDAVVQTVEKLCAGGVKVYFVTDNEKYRLAYLLDTVGLRKWCDGVFASYDVGAEKREPVFWQKTLSALNITKTAAQKSCFYWDDDGKNIAAAAEFGIPGRQYTDAQSFVDWAKSSL